MCNFLFLINFNLASFIELTPDLSKGEEIFVL